MKWYYVKAGEQAGPVDEAQLENLARTGQIQLDTLVWREGMEQWQAYSTAVPGAAAGAAGSAPTAVSTGPEAVCAECGRMFPLDETIQYGNARVCAGCKPVFMQKLAEGARIGGGLNYARFWTRFTAVFVDGILLGILNIGINAVAGMTVMQSAGGDPSARLGVQLVLLCIQMCIGATYETFMIGKYGATLGKMACKVQVVTAEGANISYGRALGRYFAKLLSALTCSIGYLIAAFDDEKRALHDRICNTRVISVG